MDYRIETKAYQYKDVNGANVVLDTDINGKIIFVNGSVPSYISDWVDITPYVDNLGSISISYQSEITEEISAIPNNQKRAVIGTSKPLVFTNLAADFLNAWIFGSGKHYSRNMFLVRIKVDSANYLPVHLLKYEGITTEISSPTNKRFSCVLREYTPQFEQLERMNLTDYRGIGTDYFTEASTFQHLRMVYAYRNKGLSTTFYFLFALLHSVVILLLPFLAINAYVKALFRTIFKTGRTHTAILVRYFLDNICNYNGLTLDTTSFDTITGFGSIFGSNVSPFYEAFILFATNEKGISIDDTSLVIRGNLPIMSAFDFLNTISVFFSIEWTILNNVLYLGKKEYIRSIAPVVFDFTNLADAKKVNGNVQVSLAHRPLQASLIFRYANDIEETAGNELSAKYNGFAGLNNYDASFVTIENTPYKGIKETNFDKFSPICCKKDDDGRLFLGKKDYINHILNSLLAFVVNPIFNDAMQAYHDFEVETANFIILDSETFQTWKIGIYDATSSVTAAHVAENPDTSSDNSYQNINGTWFFSAPVNSQMSYNPNINNNIFHYFGISYDHRYYNAPRKSYKFEILNMEQFQIMNSLGFFTSGFVPNMYKVIDFQGNELMITALIFDRDKNSYSLECSTFS